MIDLSLMRGVDVDPARRRARAQGGATWNEYNRATGVYGQATTGGVVSTTGVAGLTLGGGLGWLMGVHGLAIDNVTQIEIVTADGQVRIVNADVEPDLFWALAGRRGQLRGRGIVRVPDPPARRRSSAGWSPTRWPPRPRCTTCSGSSPRSCPTRRRSSAALVHAPDGSGMKLCALPLCHAGRPGEGRGRPGTAARLRASRVGPRRTDAVPRGQLDARRRLPAGALNYWKAAFFTELSDAAVQTMVAAFEASPSIMSAMVVEHFHGEMCRVAPTATAFPHREPGYNLVLIGQWLDPAETAANVAWVRETYAALEPYMAPKNYVNYLADDEGGPARQRLRAEPGPAGGGQAAVRPGQPLPAEPQHRSRRLTGRLAPGSSGPDVVAGPASCDQ